MKQVLIDFPPGCLSFALAGECVSTVCGGRHPDGHEGRYAWAKPGAWGWTEDHKDAWQKAQGLLWELWNEVLEKEKGKA